MSMGVVGWVLPRFQCQEASGTWPFTPGKSVPMRDMGTSDLRDTVSVSRLGLGHLDLSTRLGVNFVTRHRKSVSLA